MVHLDGKLGAVRKATLIVDQFVDVEVHLHVGISPSHVGRLRMLVPDFKILLQLPHALLPHFLGQKLGHVGDGVAVLSGLDFWVWGGHQLRRRHRALKPILVFHHHGRSFDTDHGGASDVVQEFDPLACLKGSHACCFKRTTCWVTANPW